MEIQENIALAPLTTLRVGGKARYFVRADTIEDVQAAVAFADQAITQQPGNIPAHFILIDALLADGNLERAQSEAILLTTKLGDWPQAHLAMDKYIKANNLPTQTHVIEEYVTDPMHEKDTAKWLTNIYYVLPLPLVK